MAEGSGAPPPSPVHVAIALAAVYLIWGSTYLAIRFAVETIPPFLMAGVRYIAAGAILFAVLRARGTPAPTRAQWRPAFVVGGLLLVGGNGGVSWAEQYVPSGLTALIIGTTALWIVVLEWAGSRKVRPRRGVLLGVTLGLLGVALLVDPRSVGASNGYHLIGAGVLLFASLSWAGGSLYSRGAGLPPSPFMATAAEMLAGGALLVFTGLLLGEGPQLRLAEVSSLSLISLVYLITFGALAGFTAYIWLLHRTTPSLATSYAFVNPIVAVVLGWALASEPVGPQTLAAAALIIAAVALITRYRLAPPAPAPGGVPASSPPPLPDDPK